MPHKRRMVSALFCWILLICPQKCIFACLHKNASFCESMKTLTVAEGEDVILRVNRTRSSFITWDFEKHIIAITRPGQALELEKYSYKYPGRLFSSSDASLVITKLTAQDGRIYRADLFDENCRYLCVQVYDVRIDEHGGDTPSVAMIPPLNVWL